MFKKNTYVFYQKAKRNFNFLFDILLTFHLYFFWLLIKQMVLKNVKREQISCQIKKIILSEIKANNSLIFHLAFSWPSTYIFFDCW